MVFVVFANLFSSVEGLYSVFLFDDKVPVSIVMACCGLLVVAVIRSVFILLLELSGCIMLLVFGAVVAVAVSCSVILVIFVEIAVSLFILLLGFSAPGVMLVRVVVRVDVSSVVAVVGVSSCVVSGWAKWQ